MSKSASAAGRREFLKGAAMIGAVAAAKCGVAMMPGEALNRAVSQVTGKRFEDVKIVMEVVLLHQSKEQCLDHLFLRQHVIIVQEQVKHLKDVVQLVMEKEKLKII